MGTLGGFFGRKNVEAATDTVPFVNGFRMAFNANMNQEIIRAKSIIAELKLHNETAHQLTHTIGNLLTVQRFLLEQIHRTETTLRAQLSNGRKFHNTVFAVIMTEEEPPKPPPNEDEPNPPIKEPPTKDPPIKEPPPKSD